MAQYLTCGKISFNFSFASWSTSSGVILYVVKYESIIRYACFPLYFPPPGKRPVVG